MLVRGPFFRVVDAGGDGRMAEEGKMVKLGGKQGGESRWEDGRTDVETRKDEGEDEQGGWWGRKTGEEEGRGSKLR